MEINDLNYIEKINENSNKFNWTIFYSPQNPVLEDFVKGAIDRIKTTQNIAVEGKKNSSDLNFSLLTSKPITGIEFNDILTNITRIPRNLDFTLRFPYELRNDRSNFVALFNWFTDLIFPQFQENLPRNEKTDDGGLPPGYAREGFLTMQNVISREFIERIQMEGDENFTVPEIFVQRFPYPAYKSDKLLLGLEFLFPVIIINSFLYVCINTVKLLTVEKEKRLKEAMKIMGLSEKLHWFAWFAKSIIFLTITISIITILLKWPIKENVAVFTKSNFTTIWCFLFLYSVTLIMFCFMLSSFFSKSSTGTMAAALLWFLTYMPYPITAEGYDRMSLWIKIVFCLFSNTSMAYGFKLIMRYEGTGFGLQWHNIFKPVTIDDQLTVGYCMVMFILDSVIYGIVTWYIGKINPGEYGVPLKWYFPFTLEYWRGQRRIQADPYFNNIKLSENIEPSPNYLLPGVEIRNLRKVYENSKTAVHGLNMKLFEDEITVLLGHNGAGKTTTMAMLTGMLAPTSGTALMDGLDINKQIDKIRSILGFCPQYDILFDELTVKEHIEFYCKLKGLGPDEIKEEIDKYVDLLELGAKINTPSEQLSGGQKRKLSVCVALCGRSRIVLCDEPTSGMDPSARRQLWELLLKEKKSRTILISTHFMDEADVLGDRIAIMSQGELQTMGSPFFLKKKFGVGYRLVCVKTESCNPQKVTELLSSHIPDIYIETDIGSELTYLLKESYISQFKELLEDFENNSKDLGISSFGVTLTTLEEVFLKVMHDDEHESEPKLENIEFSVQSHHNSGDSVTNSFHHKQRFLSGFALITNQSKAMFLKKRLYDLRNPIPILIQNIMPIITVILSITDYRKWNQKPDPNSLNITLGSYGHTVTLIQEDPVFDKRSFERQITHEYVKLALNETAKQEVAVIGTDFQKYLLDLMNSSLPEVNSYYMVASSVTKENREMLKNGNNVGFNLAFNSGFVFSLAAAFYIMFPIRELATKSKLLQVVSGINSVIYWGCSFIWDYLTFMVTALCYVITIAVFQEEGWSTFSELSRILILFAVFIYAVIPLCYLFAFKFTQPSAGFAKIAMIFILTGLFCFLTVFITAMDIFDLKDTSNTLTWLFLPFPHFAFSHAFNNLNVIQITKQICKSQCQHMGSCDKEFMEKVICTMIPECCDDLNYFQWKSPGVGRNVLFMFLTGTLALILLIGIERGWFKVNRNTGSANQVNNGEEPDTDVLNEKNLVKSLDPSDYFTYNLLLNDLTKYYDKFLAVDHLSLTVKSGQCFGLLGINGAGKTSTFKMLTGDHRISSGDAFIDGLSVKKELNEVYKRIGYCPQFDAVLEDLTGTETLRMYCLLRGFPEQDIPRITKKMARELNFLPHLEKKVKEYSGGNKRKLSTAVALLGDPSVIYLDEPTTGMDPGAKRQFWEIISTIRQEGKTIILTSHSMEEIQALCTRMAIMVNGSFKCLGSAQHLKNKYSRGLILTIKLKRSEMPISVLMDKSQSNDLKEFIIDRFPGAFLRRYKVKMDGKEIDENLYFEYYSSFDSEMEIKLKILTRIHFEVITSEANSISKTSSMINKKYTMATNAWDKFLLLLWKNWIIQSRHIIQTIFEILLPILFTSILLLMRGLVDPVYYPDTKYYVGEKINTLERVQWHDVNPPVDWAIAYSPTNPVLDKLINDSISNLDTEIPIRIDSNETALDLQRHLITNNIFVGVEFPSEWSTITELPKNFSFTLRFPYELRTNDEGPFVEFYNWFTDLMFPALQVAGPRNRERNDGGLPPGYFREGFIPVQAAISKAYTQTMTGVGNEEIPEIFLQRFPYPPYMSDPLLLGLEAFIPLIIVISFLYTSINIVKYITVEKEKQLKEAMKIMGLSNWLHWTAWFIKCLIFFLVTISLMTVILKLEFKAGKEISVFTYSDWSVLWVYLLVYSVASICFCFAMSVFFSKANTASMISGILWFLSYTPFAITAQSYDNMLGGTKWGLCVFSNSAVSIGFQLAMRHEGTGEGLQWSNLFKPVTQDDTFTVGNTMVMLIIDAVIYLAIALYVEKIKPGEYGIAEPWYFLFTKSFWCKGSSVRSDHIDDDTFRISELKLHNMEPDPLDKEAGIQIKNLRKVYSNKKVAVKGLRLNMYEDQITVLLGHNGAGKTTTMSMLTGMIPPTSGTATINDKDIRTDIDGVRDSLGLCPQHNILFDELTVKEHITFFSRLKGLRKQEVTAEVNKYVELIELKDKMNAQSKTLSGGMKRKLSVAISLCGGSKVVLCDEPTSGMDPSARRALWDLLMKEKQGRTILLTTHFMDEADVLGDRIAIMAEGDLKCVGSPFFLKKRFGVGYRLVVVKGDRCDPENLTNLLRKYIPDIHVETDIGSELSYVLNDKYSSVFRSIFADIEENTDSLKITSYGVSLTTLEEVFLKVGSDSNAIDSEENGNGLIASDRRWPLIVNQSYAMILKKYYYNIRNIKVLVIQNLIPIVFLILTIFTVRQWITNDVEPRALEITLNSYEKTTTVLESNSTGLDPISQEIIKTYQSLFKNPPPNRNFIPIDADFQEYILQEMNETLSAINSQYMIAGSITPNNITSFFNNQGYHTAPLTILMMQNAILKTFRDDCEIRVTNKPLPVSATSRTQQLNQGNNMGFQLAFNTGFAMAFVSAFYTLFYVKERVTRSKLLQFVSGVNIVTYWTISFIWDYLSFFFTVILYIICLVIFQEEGWRTFSELSRVTLILVLFIWAVLPLTYVLSFWFTIPSTGFTRMAMLNVLTGVIVFTVVFILQSGVFPNTENLGNILNWIFLIFPHFAMIQAFSNLNIITQTNQICKAQCDALTGCTEQLMCQFIPFCCNQDKYFEWDRPGSGSNLVYMGAVGAVLLILLLLKEYKLLRLPKSAANKTIAETEDDVMDDDVKVEKDKIKGLVQHELNEYNLVMRDMTKYYKKFLAVNQLCVGVNHSECFGLLGVNGAGKTSTFKMLTGDEAISKGDAFVQGLSLTSKMDKVQKLIGYCPQFDALLEDLTGRETLRIYCLLRGIPNDMINSVILRLGTELNFMKHIDKKVKAYSGGNKRKLSTAISMIGSPAVIYLDEPTSGMDPGARRQLWNVIMQMRKKGRSIILTSHSMEECENLCTRLAIMVNGEFKCIGSVQHLKNKFSKGFVLQIKKKRNVPGEPTSDINNIKTFINSHFPGAYLKEEHSDMLAYHIPSTTLKWSQMFGIIEDNKEALDIQDYSLGQTSLEQVFLFFTKYQRNIDEDKKRK
uniref:CSON001010 protein n=1 Tax=Culicoides sonorensis TaxID=179676 RepID=A0A336MK43_CULSO